MYKFKNPKMRRTKEEIMKSKSTVEESSTRTFMPDISWSIRLIYSRTAVINTIFLVLVFAQIYVWINYFLCVSSQQEKNGGSSEEIASLNNAI